jgi:hypothetical protein
MITMARLIEDMFVGLRVQITNTYKDDLCTFGSLLFNTKFTNMPGYTIPYRWRIGAWEMHLLMLPEPRPMKQHSLQCQDFPKRHQSSLKFSTEFCEGLLELLELQHTAG